MRHILAATLVAVISQTPAAGLRFTAPAAWQARPPASSMRVAEFVVPHAPGDTDDAEVIIYFFGGQGGSADANVQRWIGQIQQPDGTPSSDRAHRDDATINGLKVTSVDVSGTYVAEMSPGAAEHFNKPGYRLRAAVVQTPRGPYYIKMTGPARTVAAADADYQQLLRSLHPEER